MMHWRNIDSMVCTGFLLLTAGCSRKSSAEHKVLNTYSTATLIPGRELGDLQLGQTRSGVTPKEERSGKALSPKRLSEIEASAKKAAKNAVIKRMTIFMPNE
jgi:hypothetical protein